MNPGPYNEELRQFAADHLSKLDVRIQEHGRVELTPTMAFVEAMVAVPLDVNGKPWCSEPPYVAKKKPAKKRRKR